jgi:hypothetical protein
MGMLWLLRSSNSGPTGQQLAYGLERLSGVRNTAISKTKRRRNGEMIIVLNIGRLLMVAWIVDGLSFLPPA